MGKKVKPKDDNDIRLEPGDNETPENEKVKSEDKTQGDDDTMPTTEEALEAARKEAADNYDRYVRAVAELDNTKKRSAKEKEDLRKYANESLIKELLVVVDNLERAIASSNGTPEEKASILEGVEMTLKEIRKIFEKYHVNVIDALGKPFDPAFHQAFMTEESAAHEENTVLKEFQKGYLIHGRLLRPSMVVVSKNRTDGGNAADRPAEQKTETEKNN